MKKSIFLSCALGGLFFAMDARVVLKNRSLHYIEEKVDNKLFSYRQEVLEDKLKETWKVDGEVVDAQSYDELITQAEAAEVRARRKQEYHDRLSEYMFRHQAQSAVTKKLLKASITAIRDEIKLLKRYNLEGYSAFSPATIANEHEYANVIQDLLPHAQALLDEQGDDMVGYQEIVQAYAQLEPYVDKMKAFVRATVNRAIDQCDDTKYLKELLALVSS